MPQSFSSVLVHLVYSTKNRQPLILGELEPELFAYQATIFRELDSPSLTINGTSDHVHTLFRLSRKVALCDLVEEVKKRSSKWLKTRDAALACFQWQSGYAAFSIGESGVDALKKYIAGQKLHHAKCGFQDELRAFLAKYKISYDERYMWD
jgi:REP element-mobilizing transposase RayT